MPRPAWSARTVRRKRAQTRRCAGRSLFHESPIPVPGRNSRSAPPRTQHPVRGRRADTAPDAAGCPFLSDNPLPNEPPILLRDSPDRRTVRPARTLPDEARRRAACSGHSEAWNRSSALAFCGSVARCRSRLHRRVHRLHNFRPRVASSFKGTPVCCSSRRTAGYYRSR